MATYLVLSQYRGKGSEDAEQALKELTESRQMSAAMGVQIKAIYMLMGANYDFACIAEAPDDMAMAKLALALTAQGVVRTQTMRAFTEDEFKRMIESM
jgi:uncharacterized protein with GYD domain